MIWFLSYSIANVMKSSGCEIPDWMLKLKKPARWDLELKEDNTVFTFQEKFGSPWGLETFRLFLSAVCMTTVIQKTQWCTRPYTGFICGKSSAKLQDQQCCKQHAVEPLLWDTSIKGKGTLFLGLKAQSEPPFRGYLTTHNMTDHND